MEKDLIRVGIPAAKRGFTMEMVIRTELYEPERHSVMRGRRNRQAAIAGNHKRMYDRLMSIPPRGIHRDEVEAYFEGMPARYWENVTKSDLLWGLETVHAFLAKLKEWDSPGAPAVATARHCPERGFTKVIVCTWDRPGLLAKVAATFSALRINILQADVYTRADNIALDVFHVSDLNEAQVTDSERLEHVIFLLEGALNDPPRFVSVWASEFHKLCERRNGQMTVEFDNESSESCTILSVEAPDRLGLLYDILEGLNDCFMNVAQAVVKTEAGIAHDVFYLTDLEGRKVANPLTLQTLRKAVIEALKGNP